MITSWGNILGSLHLLFWLGVHPSAWVHYCARLGRGLPPAFTLADLRRGQWRQAGIQRLLAQGFLILPLMGSLPTGLLLWLRGSPVEALVIPALFVCAINLTLSLMIGVVVSSAAGIVGGVAVGTDQEEILIGRSDIVARIEQLLLDRRRPSLLLYGQRHVGRTSLLRNLGRLLPRTIVPLFVDGQRVALAGDYADSSSPISSTIKSMPPA